MAQEREVDYSTAFKKVLPKAELQLYLDSLLTTLYSEDILNDFEYSDVESEKNRIKRTRKVFDYVRGKGPKYQEKFVAILDRPGTEYWAKEIRKLAGVDGGPQPENDPPRAENESNEPRNRLGDKPSTIELLDAVIPKLAPDWDVLSVRLELEDKGRNIERDYAKVEDRCRQILRAWTDGKGLKPVTWETLLEVMGKCGYKDLADELAERLKQGETLENK